MPESDVRDEHGHNVPWTITVRAGATEEEDEDDDKEIVDVDVGAADAANGRGLAGDKPVDVGDVGLSGATPAALCGRELLADDVLADRGRVLCVVAANQTEHQKATNNMP